MSAVPKTYCVRYVRHRPTRLITQWFDDPREAAVFWDQVGGIMYRAELTPLLGLGAPTEVANDDKPTV